MGSGVDGQDVRPETGMLFVALVIGCLLTSLAVCVIVGASVYAAELEARRCSEGACDCERP